MVKTRKQLKLWETPKGPVKTPNQFRDKNKSRNGIYPPDLVEHTASWTDTLNLYYSDSFVNFHIMQKEGKLCDVKLHTKTGYVMAHKLILMAVSPYFYNSLQLSTTSGECCESLDVSHIPLEYLKMIVCFIYTGKAKIHQKNVNQFSLLCQTLGLKTVFDKLICVGKIEIIFESHQVPGMVSKSKNNKVGVYSAGTSCSSIRHNTTVGVDLKTNTYCDKQGTSSDNTLTDSSVTKLPIKHCFIENMSYSPENGKLSHDPDSEKLNHDPDSEKLNHDPDSEKLNHDPDSEKLNHDPDSEKLNHDPDSDKGVEMEDSGEAVDDVTHFLHQDVNMQDDIDLDTKNIIHDEENNKKSAPNLLKNKNKVKKLFCKKCNETFTTMSGKKLHKKDCHEIRPRRKCCSCKFSFSTPEDYAHHRNTDKHCLQIREEKQTRQRQRKAEKRSRYPCRVCARKFRQTADLVHHEFSTHDLPYDKHKWPDLKCESCTFKTISKWRLHHHNLYDCGKGKQYTCDICGNNYKNEKGLKFHKGLIHTDSLPMLPCDQCGKILKGQKGLEFHIKIMHKGEDPHKKYMCHICSQKYRSTKDLTFHIHRAHGQPLPDGFVVYSCPKCDYVINHKAMYNKHIFLHDDIRIFNCDQCEKTFKTNNSLQSHLKSHLGKKLPCPYEHCKYSALKKSHLSNHVENQHTRKGVKNEKCHVCSYSTFFKGNLLKHLRTVHQLEVVTRYTVKMKAKYKNMKTGDIVGEVPGDNSIQGYSDNTNTEDQVVSKQVYPPLENNQIDQLMKECPKPSVIVPHPEAAVMATISDRFSNNPILSAISKNFCLPIVYDNYGAENLSNIDKSYSSRLPTMSTQTLPQPVVYEPTYPRVVTLPEVESVGNKHVTGVTCLGLYSQQSVDDVSPGAKVVTYTQI